MYFSNGHIFGSSRNQDFSQVAFFGCFEAHRGLVCFNFGQQISLVELVTFLNKINYLDETR